MKELHRSASRALALGVLSLTSTAQVPFTEEAVARGVNYVTGFGIGRGVALIDLDQDGDLDLVTTGTPSGVIGVFENDGAGFFTDRSATSGIPVLPDCSGVIGGDLDGDEDADLYLGIALGPNVLLENLGGFLFQDVTATSNTGDASQATGNTLGDFDGDGLLDIYSSSAHDQVLQIPNRLYRNLGNLVFQDVTFQTNTELLGALTWQSTFFDYDIDGDMDLIVSNDKCGTFSTITNKLLRNEGGQFFTDISAQVGADVCIDSMGIAIGDVNMDGLPDIYFTDTLNSTSNPLLVSGPGGSFANFAQAIGVSSGAVGWGTVFFDQNHDGYLDLYVLNQTVANEFFLGSPIWPYVEAAGPLGLQEVGSISYCIAQGDIDDDGDVDLVTQSRNEPIRIYLNNQLEQGAWVKLKVRGVGANTPAIGARIDLTDSSLQQQRMVLSGQGFQGQSALVQHFGLGTGLNVDTIEVTWPGGAPTRTLTGYPALATWELIPPAELADMDEDGDVDLDDFSLFLDCETSPGLRLTSGCEAADLDGDADVDPDDLDLFIQAFGGAFLDCNANGISDFEDLFFGTSVDDDQNGIPDECRYPIFCNGDGGDQLGCTPCPCSNEAPVGTPGGCLNSSATSARLRPSGLARASNDSLRMEVTGANPFTFGVLTSGGAQAPANPQHPCFGLATGLQAAVLDGLRCVVQGVVRHGARPTDGGGTIGITTNGFGPPNGPAGGLIAQGGFAVGSTRYFQLVYREDDQLSCMRGQNTTNGIEVLIEP